MPKNNLSQARKGEDLATSYLISKEYKILRRNFKCELGEVDLIAQKGNTLVFVEVKSRWSDKYGDPKEAVTLRKIRTIAKISQYFKMLYPETPDLLRIDVIAINFLSKTPKIEHIENVSQ